MCTHEVEIVAFKKKNTEVLNISFIRKSLTKVCLINLLLK